MLEVLIESKVKHMMTRSEGVISIEIVASCKHLE